MASPGTLAGVLQLMQQEPGRWLPVAGATEVMVLFSAGKLPTRRFVNLWNLAELRTIRVDADSISIGGGCTFSQIRQHPAVQQHFPLLAQAALDGRLKLDELITARIKLEQVNEGFDALKRGAAIRSVVVF